MEGTIYADIVNAPNGPLLGFFSALFAMALATGAFSIFLGFLLKPLFMWEERFNSPKVIILGSAPVLGFVLLVFSQNIADKWLDLAFAVGGLGIVGIMRILLDAQLQKSEASREAWQEQREAAGSGK